MDTLTKSQQCNLVSKRRCSADHHHCPPSTKSTSKRTSGSGSHSIPDKITIFLEASSIRGMQKISKANSPFLRVLWIGFVFSMTILLFIASIFLILDYVSYQTVWNTSTRLDDETEFPAISFCSHNPFSREANKLWARNEVQTPTNLRHRLGNISAQFIRKAELNLGITNLFDKTDTYYSNLDFNTTMRLGHKRDMLLYCITKTEGAEDMAENCTLEKSLAGFHLRRFSHRNYFNCYTIEGKPNVSTAKTENIILLIGITPLGDIPEMKENFVMDMLTQGEGLKLVVHEKHTFPDIDRNGINVQPGKMNELIYTPYEWTRHLSPINPCKSSQPPVQDLDRTFKYTMQQCLDTAAQKKLIESCGCMFTDLPRPYLPSDEFPYCFNVSDVARYERITNCVIAITGKEELRREKRRAQGSICLPRCNFFTYETSMSTTKWRPSPFKFGRVNELYRNADKFVSNLEDPEVQEEYIRVLNKPQQSAAQIAKFKQLFGDEDRFTYISLSRRSTDTTVKREQLVLDIYILLSRIGGLCSLCIGLTTAFFIELVEFVYLAVKAERQRRKLKSIRRRQRHLDNHQCADGGQGVLRGPLEVNNGGGVDFHDVPGELWQHRCINNEHAQFQAFNFVEDTPVSAL